MAKRVIEEAPPAVAVEGLVTRLVQLRVSGGAATYDERSGALYPIPTGWYRGLTPKEAQQLVTDLTAGIAAALGS